MSKVLSGTFCRDTPVQVRLKPPATSWISREPRAIREGSWEFFCHFDSHDHAEIPKVTNFMDNVSKKFQNSHGIGYDFCNSTEGFRRPDGFSWTQDQMNEMWGSRPNPAPYTYQWKMREAFNPNHLNGSYYATVDPEYLQNKTK